jgi:hypothetical protein
MGAMLSNHALMKVALVIVGIVGMAMCTAGIGRVATAGRWADRWSIVAYVLGVAAIGIVVAGVAGWKLPLVRTEWQALVAVVLIIAVKIGITAIHALPTLK